MAKHKSKSKRALAPDVKEAYNRLVEGTFFDIMIAIVKAEPNEEEYGKFTEAARRFTIDQLRLIARYAAEHFVNVADSRFGKMPPGEVRRLQTTSIQQALNRLANEDGK